MSLLWPFPLLVCSSIHLNVEISAVNAHLEGLGIRAVTSATFFFVFFSVKTMSWSSALGRRLHRFAVLPPFPSVAVAVRCLSAWCGVLETAQSVGGFRENPLFHQLENEFVIIKLERGRTMISSVQPVGCYPWRSLHPPKAQLLCDLAEEISVLSCSGAELLTHSSATLVTNLCWLLPRLGGRKKTVWDSSCLLDFVPKKHKQPKL